MPEMRFTIRWPDGQRESCYSPSLIVQEYLAPGESYALSVFVAKSRAALEIASERVRQKYGFACSAAIGQLARIEEVAGRQDPQGHVTVEGFEP
ncbi:MAG: MSMEG_0570 family nitrogen starvation response protein [Janthinobacterium lividum]